MIDMFDDISMTDATSKAPAPSNLMELLEEVMNVRMQDPTISGSNALLKVLRTHHFWPALQVKKFFHEPDLVLLHNTYKRVDVSHFKTLYDECRSVVIDMSAPVGQNIIVSYAEHIPDRMVDSQYELMMTPDDVCVECYEGTVVTVYNYKDKWYFGTSSCPSVNSSRFHNPTVSHGDMFDDALQRLFSRTDGGMDVDGDQQEHVRTRFVRCLDPSKAYAFVLVHHMNKHVVDYSTVFGGDDAYAKLIHIGTRDRNSLMSEDISSRPFESIGIEYATAYATPHDALNAVRSSCNMYGVLVVSPTGQRYKVSRADLVHREECDLGSANKWVNMLWVFMQNRPDYHIQEYQKEFAPDVEIPLDSKKRPMSPTYLIYTCMCNMRDILYQLYSGTTTYYPTYRRFKMNRDIDQTYHPIVRFHLAQLRHVQVQHHHHAFLSKKAVYHYLCFHQTIKNVRVLIRFFADTEGYFTGRPRECFQVLANMLDK